MTATTRLTVVVHNYQRAELEKLVADRGSAVKLSNLIREALDQYLAEQGVELPARSTRRIAPGRPKKSVAEALAAARAEQLGSEPAN